MKKNFFHTLKKSDVTEALEKIIDGGYPRRELFLVTSLASGIAAIGLLTDSTVLIIGSMIIAPLLMPLLSVGVGIASFDLKLIAKSLTSIAIGALASLIIVIPLSLVLGSKEYLVSGSYYLTISPTIESVIVAIFAGIVSAFAVSKKALSDSMSGVAISVALIPPLAATGIALSNLDWDRVLDTGTQFLMNVLIISITSAIVFKYLDFDTSISDIKKYQSKTEKEVKKEKD
jgi:uncharacterized hydrophobic protein (TIGR00271 family)